MKKYTAEVMVKLIIEVEAESESEAKQKAAQVIIHEGFDNKSVIAQRWGVVDVDDFAWSDETIDSFIVFGA
jgi:hypothetical protein